MKTERPILFNAEMLKAILEGRKTQTRRVVKADMIPKKMDEPIGENWWSAVAQHDPRYGFCVFGKTEAECAKELERYCPYGRPHRQCADRLWVKEPFRIDGIDAERLSVDVTYTRTGESAERELTFAEMTKLLKWKNRTGGKSSLFMFKSLARVWLEIAGVRVERLQDISESDAAAEGVEFYEGGGFLDYSRLAESRFDLSARESFRTLWDSLVGTPRADGAVYSWAANPWVWSVGFKVVDVKGR